MQIVEILELYFPRILENSWALATDDVYVSAVMFMVFGDVYETVMFMVFGDVYETVMYYWKW